MRVLFISHPFGGQYTNYKRIKTLVEMLNSAYTGKYVFISPVLMFEDYTEIEIMRKILKLVKNY